MKPGVHDAVFLMWLVQFTALDLLTLSPDVISDQIHG